MVGQVEDDASALCSGGGAGCNLRLLQQVRARLPDAWILYKPHPDVSSGNRAGTLALADARRWADHVETTLGVVSCIEACDELHTMTSLAGFDALLRGKPVTTHGQPFYAGWGLTTDTAQGGVALARRQRRLTLDDGSVLERSTINGHATESTWARGQAWAIHGLASACSCKQRIAAGALQQASRRVVRALLRAGPYSRGIAYFEELV